MRWAGRCGPLVLTREPGADLRGRTVAVPSETSTAYLLFRLWAADTVPGGVGEIVVMPFHEIMPAVRDGKVDAGLVIHEARFTYQNYGLHKLADTGEHWEHTTGLPRRSRSARSSPKRSLGEETLTRLADSVRASVRAAWDDPEVSRPYVMEHAQEMDPAVADQHIGLYVNEFTADLGEDRLRGGPGPADPRGGRGTGTGPRPGRAGVFLTGGVRGQTSSWSATAREQAGDLLAGRLLGSGPAPASG